ncbi:Vomp family autotransporter [Bartonella mastomydis]|uniref:Vomp family autotransporter n=1 Tax=Bartonella mastomydis TaxID=1820002 RepID=UPI0011175CBF|nr:Vomp family autotransporter [Bartonella mastomydis]
MKKLYATQRARTLKVFRFSFVKALSLATATTFLSNISPVFASNLAITGAKILSKDDPAVAYPKGSHGSVVLSGDDDFCGADNVIDRGGTAGRGGKKITAEEEYRRFLEEVKFGNFSPYSHSDKQQVWTGNGQTSGNIGYMGGLTSGDTNILPEAFGVYSFATGCGSSAQGSYSTAFGANATARTGGSLAFGVASLAAGKVSIAVGVGSEAKGDSSVALGGLANAAGEISVAIGHKAQSTGKFAITMGDQAQATKEDSLAIGRMAHALGKSSTALGSEYNVKSEHGDNDYTTAQGDYSTALGAVSKALGYGSTAVGHRAYATQKDAVSIGFYSRANADHAIALGANSIANVAAGVAGYAPSLNGAATNTSSTWKSTYGAVSVGDIANNRTRQIGGVAAGSAATDAVNVAQLKDLEVFVRKHAWRVAFDKDDPITFSYDSEMKFSAGSDNFNVTKGDKENEVKFDLARGITLDSVKAGQNIFDTTGLKIADGPQITTSGIDAGSEKIINVADGTNTTDAVNFGQLDKAKKEVQEQVEKQVQEVEKQIASNSFVKQNSETRHITIGKETDGDKIDITNKDGGARTISGVNAGTEETDAVNFGQLQKIQKEVTEQVAANSFVKQDTVTQHITIGKDTGGDKIDITNKDGSARTISGVNAGTEETDAVNFGQLQKIQKEVTEQVAANSFVKQDAETQHITIGKDTGGDKIDITNNNKETRTLTGIKNGDISKDSKEAVTGSQLFETNQNVNTVSSNLQTAATDIAKSFGGGAGYKDGKWTDPTFTVKTVTDEGKEENATYHNVAEALTGVGTSITNVKNEITKEVNNTINTVKGDSLLWSTDDQAFSAQHGEGKDRRSSKIKFVSGGDLLANSEEAVNGGQIYTLGTNFANYLGGGADFGNGNSNGPTFKIKRVKADGEEEEQSYTNVAAAFEGVGTAFTNIKNEMTNQINNAITNVQGDSLIKKDPKTNYITIGKEVAGGEINIANNANEARTLSGVKDAVKNNEAVNKGQFDKGIENVSKDITNKFNEFTENITNVTQQVQGDALLWNEEANAFVADHGKDDAKTNSKITHLLDGNIASDSTDAITGKQLYTLGDKVAQSFGGDARYENGEWTSPTFKIKTVNGEGEEKEETYHNVSEALTGVGTSITNVQNKVTEQINNVVSQVAANSFVQQDDTTKRITIGAKEEGSEINIANKNNEDRALSGVKEATKNNEAVNKAQLDTNIKKVEEKLAEAVGNVTQQVQGDALLWSSTDNAFVADHKKDGAKTKSKITHLSDGNIASGSTDAVTGGQLYSMNEQLATYLGGGAGYDEKGNWKAPSFKVKTVKADGNSEEKNYSNVSAAFEGVGTSITNVQNKITNEITNQINHLQSDDSAVVHYDKQKNGAIDYASVTFGGKDKTLTALHNIADGTISSESHDAINGKQINKIGEDIAKSLGGNAAFNNGAFTGPTYKLSYIAKDGVVTESSLDGVGTAFAALDTNIKHVNQRIKEVSEGVAQDSLSWSKDANAFSAQHGEEEKTNSKIKFLATGDITKDSTEAINGSQLFETNNKVATYLGGGAGYKDGGWIDPTFTVKTVTNDGKEENKAYKNVEEAFEGVGTSITNVQNKITNDITNKFNDFTQNITNITQQVQGDALLWSKEANAFVADHGKDDEKKNSKLTHLLDGTISKDSTDAITGKQLYSMSNTFATYFGGGAGYDEKGNLKAPSFKVKTVNADGGKEDKTYQNVAEAFEGVGTSITNVQNTITNEITNQINHLQSDDSAVVHYDKQKDDTINYASVTFGGKDQTPTTLRNVADGSISDKSHEAITGGQIYKIGDDIAKFLGGKAAINNGAFTGPIYQLSEVSKAGQVTDKSFNDVGSAFAGLDKNIKNVNDRIKEVSEGVAQDSLNWSNTEGAFVAQHGEKDGKKTNSKIKSLAAGDISTASTEAVNGSQLYSMSNTLASYLGGGAGYDEKGKWSAPVFKVKKFDDSGKATEQEYKTVADAFEGVNQSFTNIHNEVDEKINQVVGDSLVKQNEKTHVISVGGETNGIQVSFANSDGIERVLSGVKAGDLSAKSKEAVNGSQVYALGSNVAQYFGGGAEYKDGNWTAPSFKVKTVKDNGESEEHEYKNVAEALTGVGTSFTNIKNEITNQINHLQSDDSAVVHYDKKEKDEIDYTSVTLGKGKNSTAVGLHNVANGQIANGSHDAITGGQINTIGESIAKFLGGEASFKDGGLTQPTYKLSDVSTEGKVTDKTFTDVGSAFTGLDKNIKNVNDRIKEVSEGVAQDSLNWSSTEGAFVAQHGEKDGKKTNSKIKSLAAGDISTASTEAVNGSQLYSLNQTVAQYFGGGTKYENGNWTAPSFTLKSFKDGKENGTKTYHNVADAFSDIDSNFTNVVNNFTEQVTNITQEVQGDALLWDKESKAFIAQHGEKEGKKENSKITFLANGDITADSTDAVNGSQVYALGRNVAQYFGGGAEYKEGNWKAPSFKVKTVKDNGESEEQEYKNVAEALTGVGTSFTNIKNEITNQINHLQSDDSAVVHYDKKEKDEIDYTSVTFGKGKNSTAVGLHNVADGQIADKSHDAVTGGQINTISQDVAKFLGGDTSFEKGVFTGPSYKLSSVDRHGQVKSTEFKDVGSAFSGLDTNIKNVNDRIKEVSEGVAQDSLSWSQDDNAFSAQHGEGKDRTASKITHILDGNVTKGSTDAVNGSQLYSMNNTLASYLGGGAEYKEGNWVAPSFKVNTVNTAGDKVEEKSYDNVAAAFEGVGSSFTNLHNEVTNAVTNINNHINNVVSDSLVKQDTESKVIKIGAERGGTSINIANSGDAARTLTGVKAGSLTEASTDAVNGSQLYSMNNTLASYLGGGAEYKEGNWVAPSFKVHTVSSDGSKVEEHSYKTVAEAFAGVGSSFTNIHKELKNEINQVVGDSLVKQDEKTHVIAVGGEKSGTEVTFANTDGASRSLTGVKAGVLTETSTDAVNGSQLFATNQNVTTVRNDLKTVSENTSKYLGGGADVLKGVAPTYTVQDKSYQSVAEAFGGVDRSFTQLHEEISKNTNEVSENIKQNALLWSESDKAFSAQHGEGKDRTSSKITSLANGSVTEDSTDAINGSQLYSMNNTLATYFGGGAKFENGQWIAPSFKVNTVSEDGSKVEEKSYDDVAKAFASVGTSFSNLHNEMTNAVTNINNQISQVVSDSLVKQDATTSLINIGKEVAGTEINIANKDSKDRTLSGVKAAVNDNEAVNKAQLDQSLDQLSNSLQSDDSAVVLYDKKENGETDYTNVTLGKGSNAAPVALHNVADGQIAKNSHDAVTGGQINTLSQDVAKFLGGETSFKDGTFTGPTYKLSQVDEKGEAKQAEFKDVGSAFTGLDTNIKNVNNHLTNVVQDFTQQITDITQEVKGDALLWSEDKEAFVATHGIDAEKKNSKITSLANGDITANSTDAINGSQLYSMNNTLATYFGGGAKFENGQWIAPSFKVNTVSEDGSKVEEKSYDDVAKAFASVGTSFSNLHNEMTNAVTNINNQISQVVSDSLVKQDEESKVIKIGAEKEGTEITIANSDGAVRSLSGVKAGTLSADSTEAVNGSQLYSMNNTLASYFGGGAKFENGQWIAPSFKILSFNDDGSSEETSYNNVSAAFAGVNQSFTKLHHELSETVEQNALLWSDADESFVALHGKGSEKHNSKLSHLVDGDISAGSTEAITGNQLYQLNQTLAAYLGGGASYQGGQWTAPQFQITQFKSDGSSSESKSYDNVAGAFEGVNGSLSGINDRINNVAQNVSSNSLNWNDDLGGYDGRHDGKDSKITHVEDGDVSKGSKEVVNGGQLWKTEQKVSAVEKRVDGIDKQVQDIALATDGSVKYDKDEAGNKTNKITLVGGNESDPVLIDNVAEGRIESGSKEAINGGQLHDYTEQQMKLVLEDAKKYTDEHVTDIVNNGVSESKAYTDMKFETLNYAVEDVRKEARQSAAIGLAVSNLSYDDTPGKLSFSFGTGVWRSQSAFAIGAGYMSENGKIRSNVSATSAGGHWGVGAGFRITLN